MRDVLGVDIPTSAYIDLCESAGHAWLNRDFVMICERVAHVSRDERGRLHDESGMALRYRDGWGSWMWHGIRVPQKAIMAPETITVAEADAETNAEVRRVLIERMGVDRYVRESGAKVVDMDGGLRVPGGAARVLVETKGGEKWLYGTDGSTARCYWMPVPRDVKTCAEAHSRIAGMDEARLIAES